MAQLVGLIVSQDDVFRKQIGQQLRSGAMPISVMDDRTARDGVLADIIIVDVRGHTPGCMAAIELLRAGAPAAALFVRAKRADRDLSPPCILARADHGL